MLWLNDLVVGCNAALSWWLVLSRADILAIAVVLVLHRAAAMLGMWPYAIFTLIGTAAHEFAHWLLAKMLGANPSFPSLTPTRTAGGWRLGSVTSHPNFFTKIPIALAPFLLAPLSAWWAISFMHTASQGKYALHAWIAGTLLMASLPSSQDWTVAAPPIIALVSLYLLFF